MNMRKKKKKLNELINLQFHNSQKIPLNRAQAKGPHERVCNLQSYVTTGRLAQHTQCLLLHILVYFHNTVGTVYLFRFRAKRPLRRDKAFP